MRHEVTGDRIDLTKPPEIVIDPTDRWLAEMRFVLPDGITVGEVGAVLHQVAHDLMKMPHGNSNAVFDPDLGFAFASVLNKNEHPETRDDVIVFPITVELHEPMSAELHWFALSQVEQTVLAEWQKQRDGDPIIHDTDLERLLDNDDSI